MKTSVKGLAGFGAIVLLSFMIGDFIMTSAFFGCLILLGMYVMINRTHFLIWIVMKMNTVIDISIFLFTIFAMASIGLNMSGALTVAGLGYTMWMAPHFREKSEEYEKKRKPVKNNRSNYDMR